MGGGEKVHVAQNGTRDVCGEVWFVGSRPSRKMRVKKEASFSRVGGRARNRFFASRSSEHRPLAGDPGFHPSDEDLSPGTPV